MAQGEAGPDRCPPGGDRGARALAQALGRTTAASATYDRTRGQWQVPHVARVIEADCIGCTKCIQACPVDAIAGARQAMHAIIEPLCTGCGLCLPPCPVDCIVLLPR